MRSGTLYARRMDARTLEFTGEERRLAENLLYRGGSWVGAFGVSEAGPLIFVSTGQPMGSRLSWFDMEGKQGAQVDGLDVHWGFRFSPDGTKLAVAKGDPEPSLYVLAPERGTQTRIAATAQFARSPVWSPDGTRIIFGGFEKGHLSLFEVPVDGSNAPKLVYAGDTDMVPTDWSPDGRTLLIDHGPPGSTQIWGFDLENRKASPLVERPPLAGDGRFSPDGKWMIYSSRETGVDQLYLAPFPGVDRRWQLSTENGAFGRWLPGGDGIVYLGEKGLQMVSVAIERGNVTLGAPRVLFLLPADNPVYTGWEGFLEPAPDGRRLLCSHSKAQRRIDSISLVLNWDRELESGPARSRR